MKNLTEEIRKALKNILEKRGGLFTENELLQEVQKTIPFETPGHADAFYRCITQLSGDPDISVFYAFKAK